MDAWIGFRPLRLEGHLLFVAQGHGLPFQCMGEGELGIAIGRERKDWLQISQVIRTGVFAHYKQAIDVGVAEGLAVGVVLEQRQVVVTIFGFDGLFLQLDARAFQ